jgi:hypothetical protein
LEIIDLFEIALPRGLKPRAICGMFDIRAETRTLQNFKIALPLFIAVFIFREQWPFTIPLHDFPHE